MSELFQPSVDFYGALDQQVVTLFPSFPEGLPVQDYLDYAIRRFSQVEQAKYINISSGTPRVRIPGWNTDGGDWMYPDTLRLEPGRELQVVSTLGEAMIAPGSTLVSPDFGYCQGIFIQSGGEVAFRHNFAIWDTLKTSVQEAVNFAQRVTQHFRKVDGVTVVAENEKTLDILAVNFEELGFKSDALSLNLVERQGDEMFRIWGHMNHSHELAFQVTSDNAQNSPIPTYRIR